MAKINIINPGLFSTIQDMGRTGFQEFGMPVSGAMDRYSMMLANYLAGNDLAEACIEATLIGPEIEFESETAIGICGAEVQALINGEAVDSLKTILCKAGDTLSFEYFKAGTRVYIAFGGGIDVPLVMNSKSTYIRAKIGGLEGRNLTANDSLNIANEAFNIRVREISADLLLNMKANPEIRVIAGTEIQAFSIASISNFLTSTYEVSPESDRMGFRLNGNKIGHQYGADILSSGISRGAIQIPGHGQPIIMMADHQTVGGYTKIANVITTDLPLVGQMKPGDSLHFKEVRLDEAHELLHARQHRLRIHGILN